MSELGAVVIGVVCGVLAGIPTSILILVTLATREQRAAIAHQAEPQRDGPAVIVIEEPGQGEQHRERHRRGRGRN